MRTQQTAPPRRMTAQVYTFPDRRPRVNQTLSRNQPSTVVPLRGAHHHRGDLSAHQEEMT